MSENTMWVIGGLLLAVVLLGLVMGRRLRRAKFNLGKGISAEVHGNTAGPAVRRAEADGDKNRITANGDGALVEDVRAKGNENVIGAGTRETHR